MSPWYLGQERASFLAEMLCAPCVPLVAAVEEEAYAPPQAQAPKNAPAQQIVELLLVEELLVQPSRDALSAQPDTGIGLVQRRQQLHAAASARTFAVDL